MAYNAGPNRILRYLEEDGEVPDRFLVYPQKVAGELKRLERKRRPLQQVAFGTLPQHGVEPARAGGLPARPGAAPAPLAR